MRRSNFGHQRQIDHRRFVHHQHVERQRIAGVMAETRRIARLPSSRCSVLALSGDTGSDVVGQRQPWLGLADRFARRAAALPVGAASRITSRPSVYLLQSASSLTTVVVLPVLGPPEITHSAVAIHGAGGGFLPVRLLFAGGEQAVEQTTQLAGSTAPSGAAASASSRLASCCSYSQ